MAITHAQPGEVLQLLFFESTLAEARTTALIKTSALEVIRLILPAGKEIPTHHARGEITVQCLRGRVEFTAAGKTHELTVGNLLYLTAGAPHSLKGIDDAALLVTLVLPENKASH